jgi:hypothetical protein
MNAYEVNGIFFIESDLKPDNPASCANCSLLRFWAGTLNREFDSAAAFNSLGVFIQLAASLRKGEA